MQRLLLVTAGVLAYGLPGRAAAQVGAAHDLPFHEGVPAGSTPAAVFPKSPGRPGSTAPEGPPPNDACANAFPLFIPDSVEGSTLGATPDGVPGCAGAIVTAGGVWYSIVGNGDEITLTTCAGASFDTQISVFCGGCDDLQCVAANDDDCVGGGSRVSWCSEPGVEYLILVHGYGPQTGDFILDVTSAACGTPFDCADCTIDPPIGAIPEGEGPCADGSFDTFNGGCNSEPPVYSPMVIGESIVGTSGTYTRQGQGIRDTDWFQFEVVETSMVTLQGAAEFPLQLGLIDGNFGCRDDEQFDFGEARGAPCDVVTISAILEPGRYIAWVGPSVQQGVPCGTPYWIELTAQPAGACELPSGCVVLTEDACASLGGVYQGDGTGCTDVGYTWSSVSSTFEDISQSGTSLSLGDDDSIEIPIDFPFVFFDQVHEAVRVSSNGYLTFGLYGYDPRPEAIPDPSTPNAFIAPRWDNLNPLAGGSVHYDVLGSEPTRRLIVQWTNVPRFGFSDQNRFQVALFEQFGRIEFRYGTVTPEQFEGDFRAGVENADGSRGTEVPPSQTISNAAVDLRKEELVPPVANAGGPYVTSAADLSTIVDGGLSFDPDGDPGPDGIASWQWDLGADGIGDDASRTNQVESIDRVDLLAKGVTLAQGVPLRLIVTDVDGLAAIDQVDVTWANAAPTADGGGPYPPVGPGECLQLLGMVADAELDFPVGESLAWEWDVAPALNASEIGDGFSLDLEPCVEFEDLQQILQQYGSQLYLNVHDVSGEVATAVVEFQLALPDLRIASTDVPGAAIFGGPLDLSWIGLNDGGASAVNSWTDRVILSRDQIIGNADDVALEPPVAANADPLGAGETYPQNGIVALPLSAEFGEGLYYISVVADAPGNAVEEGDETNNASQPASIQLSLPPLPDIVLEDISFDPLAARAGSEITLSWTNRNAGTANADGQWTDRLYLSTDRTLSGDDPLLGTFQIDDTLEPGEAYQRVEHIALPFVDAGLYFVIIEIDAENDIIEVAGESNNIDSDDDRIDVLPPEAPDLVITAITPPANAVPGAMVEVAYTITNLGQGPADGTWSEALRLSSDDVIGDDDDLLIHAPGGFILPGQSVGRIVDVTIPQVAAGDYWISICLNEDESFEESDYANNCAIEEICANCKHPNLRVLSVEAPSEAIAGQSVPIQWAVENTGAADAIGSWVDRVLISETVFASDGILLAERRRTTPLSGDGGIYLVDLSVAVPPEIEGPRYFIVVTDVYNELDEPGGESNNEMSTLEPTEVSLPEAPDLRTSDVTVLTTDPTFDAPIDVSWIARNHGDAVANGPWTDRVYLSIDPARGPDDIPLGDPYENEMSLDPDGEYAAQWTVDLPLRAYLTPGDYYIVVTTDVGNAVGEQIESNNWASSGRIFIDRPQLPDLRVQTVSVPQPAAPGEEVTVVYTVTNQGDEPVEATWTELVLASTDSQFGNDFFGSEQIVTERLEPGESVIREGTLTVPNVPFEYWPIVCVDVEGEVFESDESNNCTVSTSPGTVARPDVVPSNVYAESDEVFADAQVLVNYELLNLGRAPTYSTFVDSVWLVGLGADTNSYLVGTHVHQFPIGALDSEPVEVSIRIPGRIAGPYRLEVRTDVASNLIETSETNNTSAASTIMNVYQPDRADLQFVPLSIQPPGDDLVTSPGIATWIVMNTGLDDAVGPWIDRIVARPIEGGPAVQIGTFVFEGTIPPLGMEVIEADVNLPTIPGEYEICVELDSGDVVNEGLEGGEDNNEDCANSTLYAYGYHVVAVPSIREGQAGDPVEITGHAERDDGTRLPFMPARVKLNVRGTNRIKSIDTDENGEFTYRAALARSEAGQYVVTAGSPGNIDESIQEEFVLHGLRTTPTYRGIRVYPGLDPFTARLEFYNAGDLPLTNLQLAFEGLPEGVNIDLDLPESLAGQQIARPLMTITADEGAEPGTFEVSLICTTAQGAMDTTVLFMRVGPPDAQLDVNPGTLVSGMLQSQPPEDPNQTLIEFEITNIGGQETGALSVALPGNTPWMTLSTPPAMASLGPDESARIVLILAPTTDDPIGLYEGQLVVRFPNGPDKAVPYRFTHVTDAVGDIQIAASNEETYWAPTEPPLANATVTLRSATTNQIFGTSVTGTDGLADFDDMPVGPYYVEVSKSDPPHTRYQNLSYVECEQETSVDAFLPRQVVTYTWTVDPTQIEDRYRFVLDVDFVTTVYAPVITLEPHVVDFDDIETETQINFTVTNHGLVAAEDVLLDFIDAPAWAVIPLTDEIGTLAAGEEVTIPVVIRRLGGLRSGIDPCILPSLGVCHTVDCGGPRRYRTSSACRYTTNCDGQGTGHDPGSGGGGSGSNDDPFGDGPGGGTGSDEDCDPCAQDGSFTDSKIVCLNSEASFLAPSCQGDLVWIVNGEEIPYSANPLSYEFEESSQSVGDQSVDAFCICDDGQRIQIADYDVTVVELQILNGGTLLDSEAVQDTAIGIGHDLEWQIVPSGAVDVGTADTQWAISGQHHTGWIWTQPDASSQPKQLTSAERMQQSLPTYYWFDPQQRTETVSCEVRGPDFVCSTEVDFNVLSPTASALRGDPPSTPPWIHSPSTPGCAAVARYEISYADRAGPGQQAFRYLHSVSSPSGFPGRHDLVQIATSLRIVFKSNADGCWGKSVSGRFNDTRFLNQPFYRPTSFTDSGCPTGSEAPCLDDVPGACLREQINGQPFQLDGMEYDLAFDLWLMWKPETSRPACWVPLRKMSWTVNMEALPDGQGSYTGIAFGSNGSSSLTSVYPTWTDFVENVFQSQPLAPVTCPP